MQWKNKYLINNLVLVFDSSYFKISILIAALLSIYAGYLSSGLSYLGSFNLILSHYAFIPFGIFLPLLIVTIIIYNFFEKSQFIISRFETRKKYLKELIKNIVIINLCVYTLIMLLIIISLNFFPKQGLGLEYNGLYATNNLIYLIFLIFKVFMVSQFLNIITILLSKLIDIKIPLILNVILYGIIVSGIFYSGFPVNSVMNMPLILSNYIIGGYYDSFNLELICTIIYLTFLLLICYLFFLFTKKYYKKTGG